MLSFTGDALPNMPDIRQLRTTGIVCFTKITDQSTKVHLTQIGWGKGGNWDKAFDYFFLPWADQVLPYLKYSVEKGAINWNKRPSKSGLTNASMM